MASGTPMLDDVELKHVQKVEAEDEQVLAEHGVPALEGDFLQDLGRRVTRFTLIGVMTGTEAGDQLNTLRLKFRNAEPVSFVSDIATATTVDKVLIEEFGVRELAGKPERFEYQFTLREFLPAPPPIVVDPPPPPTPEPEEPEPVDDVTTGTLVVEVNVVGQPDFDFSKVTVTVDGTKDDGSTLSALTLTNRTENVWTEENMVLGQFTVHAVVTEDPAMSGSAAAAIRSLQTTRAQINLQPGAIIATTFVVHFRFDNAFIEPCMREVLDQVARHAADNSGEKLLIVGHTDKTGDDPPVVPLYNQSLSERRARSVFAYLNFANDQAGSEAEWKELRQPGTGRRKIRDNWGTRQYQYMLQSLGFYPGQVDGDHGPLTDDAVRTFRAAKGLPVGTTVNDDVWEALIHDYLAETSHTVPDAQFLRNAKDACNGGTLKWLGCGEEDPLPLPQPSTREAHRPYRRAEMLFVNATQLACEVPQPDTFDLPSPGAVNSTWCLGPGNASRHCCFATRNCPSASPGQWCITPFETGSFVVRGRILFEDGTPAANMSYVLIAPDGEFMDGEAISGGRRGDGNFGQTRADGTFEYTANPKGPGVYTMEINSAVIARLDGEAQSEARGNVVCMRLDGSAPFNVVVRSLSTVVNPIITLASAVVVVKKTYTNPARQIVTLTTDGPFFRPGTVTRAGAAIRFFDAAVAGNEITFNGTDNVFSGAQLSAGVQLFAEGAAPSVALDDVVLTLTLTPGATPIGPPATATMTSVELTLDVALSRVAAGVDPPLMPQPPGVTPAPGTATDKFNLGRFVQVQDPSFSHERAMLVIQPPSPAAFAGTLVLTPVNAQVQAFNVEGPAAGQLPVTPMPFPVPNPIPAGGTRLFVDAVGVSNNARDTGYQLGIQGVEVEGDKVAMTTTQLAATDLPTAAAPPLTFSRFGLWDNAYDAAGNVQNGVPEASNFVGADRRKFHLRVTGPLGLPSLSVDWKSLRADRLTNDDAPAPATAADSPLRITLPAIAAGSPTFISRGLMLVTDDTDRDFATNSGLNAPFDVGLRLVGQSNHRTRRARIDGFIHAEFQPAPGQLHRIVWSVFDRAVPFDTTSPGAVAVGVQVVTPVAMSALTATGVRWTIRVGTRLTIDTGATQEQVVVTAATATTFTANFTQAHIAGFRIAGTVDERRRLRPRVMRYTQAGVPTATDPYITAQFANANLRWNTVGLQIDPSPTEDRPAPAGALLPIPGPPPETVFAGGGDSAQEQAALNDLIPVTTDNTLTIVFVPIDTTGFANAYATLNRRFAVALQDRFFIFIDDNINLEDYTLAHELHHVLFNRGDGELRRQFFTFNTNFAPTVAAAAGIVLPDVRMNRRVHTVNSADPNNDPPSDNTANWVRRRRTIRFPIGSPFLSAATASTGNTLVVDFT